MKSVIKVLNKWQTFCRQIFTPCFTKINLCKLLQQANKQKYLMKLFVKYYIYLSFVSFSIND